jgi:hypothetical protein
MDGGGMGLEGNLWTFFLPAMKESTLKANQKYLKFSLTPSLSPMGRGEG